MEPAGFFMRMQAALFATTAALVALTGRPWLTWALCGSLLAIWLVLDHNYAKNLGRRERTRERRGGDRAVWRQVALLTSAPSVFAGIVSSGTTPWGSVELSVGISAVASFWLVTYASGLVDWYYIRPRRDGVVTSPPCRGPHGANWTEVTRIWYLHRGVVVIVGAVSAIAAITAFALALGIAPSGKPEAVGSLVVAAVGAGLAISRVIYGSLSTIGDVFTSCCFSAPDIAIGDNLVGPRDVVGGYVRDVAPEGITVVVLNEYGYPEMVAPNRARTKRHALAEVIDKPEIAGEPLIACPGSCRHFNDQCEWKEREPAKAPKPANLLVLDNPITWPSPPRAP